MLRRPIWCQINYRASSLVWHEVVLRGNTAAEFDRQILNWSPSRAALAYSRQPKSGNPIYEKPVVLVIYLEEFGFLLDKIIPRRGTFVPITISSSPHNPIGLGRREFKAKKLSRHLRPALYPVADDRYSFARQRSRIGNHSKRMAGRAAFSTDAMSHESNKDRLAIKRATQSWHHTDERSLFSIFHVHVA